MLILAVSGVKNASEKEERCMKILKFFLVSMARLVLVCTGIFIGGRPQLREFE
jgi:hypothetical protein